MHTIDLAGSQGNVFAIFGIASNWNKQLRRKRDLMEVVKEKHPDGEYFDVLDEFDNMFKNIVTYEFINDPRDE